VGIVGKVAQNRVHAARDVAWVYHT
jgi:hypothetical protein